MLKNGRNVYLRHVDGLRALAVLSVIFYHFGIAYTPGGYLGVDVFFVISGFLITRIISNEISETGGFDFAGFYIRRMRRLFPALFVTLAASFIIASALLSPRAFDLFGRSLVAAVCSVANILFWWQSGYFGADSYMQPLLHTWSLSVEEQLYILWPALLWLLMVHRPCSRLALALTLFGLGIASITANSYWATGKLDANFRYSIFFLAPFRVFEFVIGGLGIYLLEITRHRHLLQELLMAAGLAAIAFSIATYNYLMLPCWYALLPCLGSLAVIVSGNSRWSGRLLTNPLAVGIGLLSYSLYLVHWPIVSFFRYINIAPATQLQTTMLLGATFASALALYWFIETPFRRIGSNQKIQMSQNPFVLGSVGSMTVLAGLGLIIVAQEGWAWRQPNALNARQSQDGRERRFILTNTQCSLETLDDTSRCHMQRPRQVLFFGDSHEPDGYNAFAAVYGDDPSVNLISFGTINNCEPSLEQERAVSKVAGRGCAKRVAKLSDPQFITRLDAVVYSANKPFALSKGLEWKILAGMQRINPKLVVVVLGGYLNTKIDCDELFNRTFTFDTCKERKFVTFSPFDERKKSRLSMQQLSYLYIDFAAMLCPNGQLSSCIVQADGEPFAYDQHHLSYSFAQFVGRQIAQMYGPQLEKGGLPSALGRMAARIN
jgi:peptidoglycan/LPS O-acetylase OafA/YrhL